MCGLVEQAMREGRARRLLVAPVRARHVQLDRRADRDGEGRRAVRRRVLHPPALRGQRDRRVARRGLPDRARGGHPHADLAPQDGLQAELGKDAGDARAARGGAGRRASTSRPTSTRGRAGSQRPRRLPAAVDARGRPRRAAEAPRRPGARASGRRRRWLEDSDEWRTSISARAGPDRRAGGGSVIDPKLKTIRGARRSPRSPRPRRRIRATS